MMAHPRIRRGAVLGLIVLLTLVSWRTWGRPFPVFPPAKPYPDIVNLRYGPHERNVLDLWLAKPRPGATAPPPLVVFFHGGGFRSGDKSSIPAWLVSRCLDAGISVASANYRLSRTAPFPAPMRDGARAIQFLRFRANELGIDPGRIAASGNSAGAGIALWVGFHDDLADPSSGDPIARRSSRVACLGVDGAQTSYDPRFIKDLIGGRAHEHPALRSFYGIKSNAELDSPEVAQARRARASPLTHVVDLTRRFSFITPSPTRRCRPTPSRGRGFITLASARRSRPVSTRSASNASSATTTITRCETIRTKTCSATWRRSSRGNSIRSSFRNSSLSRPRLARVVIDS